MSIVLRCLALSLAVLLPAAAAAGEKNALPCVDSAAGTCVLPFQALFARPVADYAGQVVRTSGFLRRVGDDLLLFSGSEIARYAPGEAAIVLIPGNDGQRSIAAGLPEGFVHVSGRLRGVSPAHRSYWAELELTQAPWPMGVVSDSPPPPPPPDPRQPATG